MFHFSLAPRFAALCALFAAMVSAVAAPNVLLEDTDVRVVLASVAPGQKSQPHHHTVNRVMIALDDGKMRLAFDDGKVVDREWKTGDVWWDTKGGTHTSENLGGAAYRLIEVELKRPGGGSVKWPGDDPAATSPAHFKVELDNEQVRVMRLTLAPKEKTALHSHQLPRVMVYLNAQQVRMTLANGRGSTFRYKAGQVTRGGKARHAESNLGAGPLTTLFIELKPSL